MGKNALALRAALDTARANVDELGQASAEVFQQHPDYAIITSFPGLADSTGARLFAEIGDDRRRFADARTLVRLANVGWIWAFTAAPNLDDRGSGRQMRGSVNWGNDRRRRS